MKYKKVFQRRRLNGGVGLDPKTAPLAYNKYNLTAWNTQ